MLTQIKVESLTLNHKVSLPVPTGGKSIYLYPTTLNHFAGIPEKCTNYVAITTDYGTTSYPYGTMIDVIDTTIQD